MDEKMFSHQNPFMTDDEILQSPLPTYTREEQLFGKNLFVADRFVLPSPLESPLLVSTPLHSPLNMQSEKKLHRNYFDRRSEMFQSVKRSSTVIESDVTPSYTPTDMKTSSLPASSPEHCATTGSLPTANRLLRNVRSRSMTVGRTFSDWKAGYNFGNTVVFATDFIHEWTPVSAQLRNICVQRQFSSFVLETKRSADLRDSVVPSGCILLCLFHQSIYNLSGKAVLRLLVHLSDDQFLDCWCYCARGFHEHYSVQRSSKGRPQGRTGWLGLENSRRPTPGLGSGDCCIPP